LLNLLVGFLVDVIQLGAGVVDELGDLVDDRRHALVQVRLIHHGHRVTHVHAVHAVDHVAGIVRIESICGSADARCCPGVRLGLVA
jgi:hypothetical protein